MTADSKVETLVAHIREGGSTLVFVRTKRGADRLVQKLKRHDVRAVAMHGDMSQNARERALAQFEGGKVSTLVATDVAARGLDLDDVTHVVNFDPPDEDKGYVHRTGRTGRAGRSGTAITFVLPEQQADTSRVARRLGHQSSSRTPACHRRPRSSSTRAAADADRSGSGGAQSPLSVRSKNPTTRPRTRPDAR